MVMVGRENHHTTPLASLPLLNNSTSVLHMYGVMSVVLFVGVHTIPYLHTGRTPARHFLLPLTRSRYYYFRRRMESPPTKRG